MKNHNIFWPVIALLGSPVCLAAEPVVDNERVTVWDTTELMPHLSHDFVAVPLFTPGTAVYGHQGEGAGTQGKRTIVIELKDLKVEPLPNPGPYPLAFPRARAKKLFENDRVVIWSTRWLPGKATPLHFHDKEAVVVFEAQGELKSTTLDGRTTPVPLNNGKVSYNARNRVHTEVLVSGAASAVVTELK
jgi:hypothetical protein